MALAARSQRAVRLAESVAGVYNRPMRIVRNTLVVASVSLVACSLVTDLSGVAPAAPDGSTVDSSTDAGSADAARSSCDAGFCACRGDAHSFCDDFDDNAALARWKPAVSPGGQLFFDDSGTFSRPNALLASAGATDGAASFSFLDRINRPLATRVRVEFAMKVEKFDPAAFSPGTGIHGFSPVSIKLRGPGGAMLILRMNMYSNAADLEQLAGTIAVANTPAGLPTGAAANGRYGIWLDLPTQRCGATFNGVESAPLCQLAQAFQDAGVRDTGVVLGIEFLRAPSLPWSVHIDDVLIDYD